MNTTNGGKLINRIRTPLGRLSMRSRITLSMMLAFIMVMPVVSLTLYYFPDFLAESKLMIGQDVEVGRTATDLCFTMLEIQQQERNYRIFGSSVERERIEKLLAHSDSILIRLRSIKLASEENMIEELFQRLDEYKSNFGMLNAYLLENPLDARMWRLRSRFPVEYALYEKVLLGFQAELEKASSARRDSIFTKVTQFVDNLSLDRIVGFDSRDNQQASYLQQSLASARRGFLVMSRQLADATQIRIQKHQEEILRIEARAKRNIILLIILTAILLFLVIFRLPGLIIRPISRLSAIFHKAGDSEWGIPAPVTTDDEVGEMAASYNQAMERIRLFDDLKTKRIATQRRFIERLIDYIHVPVCILTRNLNVLYVNSKFTGIFGQTIPLKIPDGGFDITRIPEMNEFVEVIRKHIAQAGGDFQFTVSDRNGDQVALKGRPVRNTALSLESIVVIGIDPADGKDV